MDFKQQQQFERSSLIIDFAKHTEHFAQFYCGIKYKLLYHVQTANVQTERRIHENNAKKVRTLDRINISCKVKTLCWLSASWFGHSITDSVGLFE